MRIFLVQHLVGILAQVAAALPLLLITALLAHTVGLEYSGRFAITSGLSAFAFSLAGWGLRTHILIGRLEAFSALEYLAARGLATVVATVASFLAGYAFNLPSELVAAVVLFRTCDALIDLNLAFDQVSRSGGSALNRYALVHGAKAVALVVTGIPVYFLAPHYVGTQIIAAGALVATGAVMVLLANIRHRKSRPFDFAAVRSIFNQSKWFASAEIGSSSVVSAPRISLVWLYSGSALGVIGTSLTIAGFFGMAFYTSWLRFLPRFSGAAKKSEAVRSLLLETVAIALLLAVAAWFVLPTLAAFVFAFHEPRQMDLSREVLLSSVAFFAGMNVVNLYKISRHPWMETVSYINTVLLTAILAWVFPSLRQTPALLLVAGFVMFCFSVPNLRNLLEPRRVGANGVSPLAIFARISSRPVPRVTRMMRVASDAGYACEFIGAMREDGLPRKDLWQGWKITRIGPMFALLNGRRPLIYAKSIAAYNIALFQTLCSSAPVLVHCSDCETMPAAILYRLFNRSRLIFNIHDNISQRYRVPKYVAVVLNTIEGAFVLCSDVATVPEQFRRSALPRWCRNNVIVTRNTPIDPGMSEPVPAGPRIRIFFGGWLDWGRGLRPLIEIASSTPRIELRIAGEGEPSIVDEIKRNANVVFLGFLEHEKVMAETKLCHFVSAFYDPSRVINRFAASNKIAEALAVGRPILMNSELEIAKVLDSSGCTLTMPYSDIAGSSKEILAFADNWDAYRVACTKARAAYEAGYAWEAVRDRMRELVNGTSVNCFSKPNNPMRTAEHQST